MCRANQENRFRTMRSPDGAVSYVRHRRRSDNDCNGKRLIDLVCELAGNLHNSSSEAHTEVGLDMPVFLTAAVMNLRRLGGHSPVRFRRYWLSLLPLIRRGGSLRIQTDAGNAGAIAKLA